MSTVFLILVACHEITVNLVANVALAIADGTVSARRALESPERLVEETLPDTMDRSMLRLCATRLRTYQSDLT